MTDDSTETSLHADDTERYARSPLTGQWYLVTDWIHLGGGQIQATEKTPVTREDVPERWLAAIEDTGADRQ